MNRKSFFARNFFFLFSLLFLSLSLIAFSDNLITDVGQESNFQPRFIIHGLLMLAWYLIIVIQTNQIRKLNYRWHMRFGLAGFSVALLAMATIFYLHWIIGNPFSELNAHVKANRVFGVIGTVLILSSFLFRKKPLVHKYCLFTGLIFHILPIIDRAVGRLGLNMLLFIPLGVLGLWLLLFSYDIHIRRKLHPILYVGFIAQFGIYIYLSI